jgi:hypothetical protein
MHFNAANNCNMLLNQATSSLKQYGKSGADICLQGSTSGKVVASIMEVLSRVETSSERSQSIDFVDLNDSTDAKGRARLGHLHHKAKTIQEMEQSCHRGDSLVAKFLERTPEIPLVCPPSSENPGNVCRVSASKTDVSLEQMPRESDDQSNPFHDSVGANPSEGPTSRPLDGGIGDQKWSQKDTLATSQMFKTREVSSLNPVFPISEDLREAVNSHKSFQSIAQSVRSLNDYAQQSMEEIREHIRGLDTEDTPEIRSRKVSGQTHSNVMCQGCLAFTIRGKRFVCLKCPSLNLCTKCERKTRHPHPMLRLVEPLEKGCHKNLISIATAFEELRGEDQAGLRLRVLQRIAGEDKGEQFYRVFLDRLEGLDLGTFVVKAQEIFKPK